MEKSEFRVLIKHYFLRGKTIAQTEVALKKYYPDSAPSHKMVHKWFTEFKCGRTNTEDAPRPGRPVEVTTSEMVDKVHDMVMDDPKLKVREIAETVSISTERVVTILHEHCHMRKLCAKWVPRLLTEQQKRIRVTTSQRNLEYFNNNPNEFLRRFVTMDETWIHHSTPESREGSKQWVEPGGSAPKRPKTQYSAGKVMASVFWDAQGIIFVDYLQKGKTITGEYYASLLYRLVDEIKLKRPHMQKKKILFHDDNAPSHTSFVALAKKLELGFESLPHPPYSPDLAPSDYYLFPNLKRWLCGKRFESNEEVQWETEAYFGELDQSYYKKGIEKIKDRWNRCIELKGEYTEK